MLEPIVPKTLEAIMSAPVGSEDLKAGLFVAALMVDSGRESADIQKDLLTDVVIQAYREGVKLGQEIGRIQQQEDQQRLIGIKPKNPIRVKEQIVNELIVFLYTKRDFLGKYNESSFSEEYSEDSM